MFTARIRGDWVPLKGFAFPYRNSRRISAQGSSAALGLEDVDGWLPRYGPSPDLLPFVVADQAADRSRFIRRVVAVLISAAAFEPA